MCLGSLLSYLGPGEALGVENIMSTPDHTPYTPPFTTHAFTLLLDYPYHFYTSPLKYSSTTIPCSSSSSHCSSLGRNPDPEQETVQYILYCTA